MPDTPPSVRVIELFKADLGLKTFPWLHRLSHRMNREVSLDPGVNRLPQRTGLAGYLHDRRSVQHLEHRPVTVLGHPPPVVQDVPRPSKLP
ncbi:hypothetical protein AB0M11_34775 [Streptomyces sp. NPDC051987]|uniref:hypothetical protein n=1 Tax=Streptomyces sp. NPDC051987 TaxID=3155808 RepID=UPI0034319891